jgi:hypothetical protein
MSFLRRLNPLAGLRDLRVYLSSRPKHEVVFAFLALATTVTILVGFYLDSGDLKRPYKRDIQYVESWPMNRTDAEIIAAQKTDMINRKKREAEEKARQEKNRQALKRIDDALSRWGI